MKKLNFVWAAALVAVAAPTAAQFTSSSYEFVKAVRERNAMKAMELLKGGAQGLINARDGDGNTPLIITIARRDGDWAGFMISKGADVNVAGKNGDTALITASRVGFEEAVPWLLAKGARVDASNRMGETALIVAVQQRQTQIAKLLLEAGANPDKTDNAAGLSARDYARRDARSRDILALIESAKKPAPKSDKLDDFKLKQD